MKVSTVRVILAALDAAIAGQKRLINVEDGDVTTAEQAEEYTGPTFVEGEGSCICDLHVIYREGMVLINFVNEEGDRVNYDYPIHSIKRVNYTLTKGMEKLTATRH